MLSELSRLLPALHNLRAFEELFGPEEVRSLKSIGQENMILSTAYGDPLDFSVDGG